MDRRRFLVFAGQAFCVAGLAPSALLTSGRSVGDDLDAHYRKCLVVDSLCAPVSSVHLPLQSVELDQAKQSGVSAVNFTVSEASFEDTVSRVAYAHALVNQYSENFLLVRRHADLDAARHEGKVGIMLGFQHASPFESDLERIETFRRLGVRIMQITYNNRSLLGDGCLEPENSGLSRVGHEAVRKMNALGVALDLSHSGQTTTREGIAASERPVLVTHSGCAALHAHPRNKDDQTMKQLADRGGYFGVYLMPYLTASPSVPGEENVLEHLQHALDVCGSDHVGIGSDGSLQEIRLTAEQQKVFANDMATRKKLGIAAPEEDRLPYVPELNTPLRMEKIAEGLRQRGVIWPVIEKVLGQNFHRIIVEIWGAD